MNTLAPFELFQNTTVVSVCAGSFVLIAFAFIISILFSRVLKTHRGRQRDKLREEFQKILNTLIVHEHSKENLNYSLVYYLKELRRRMVRSAGEQLLVDLLISNKQNLKGNSAAILKRTYVQLKLKKSSILKLRQNRVIVKIQGLHELAEMECVDSIQAVRKLLTHRHLIVRQESFIAMVRLSGAFALAANYKGTITPWMQLTIHRHFSMLPAEQLPKFHLWFKNPNREIRKLAVTLAHHFRQSEVVPFLSTLLNGDDLEVTGLAIDMLGEMGAVEYADDIARVGKNSLIHDSISGKVIRALGQIGSSKKHTTFLTWHMIHGSDELRLEAMNAMRKLNLNCRDFLIDFNAQNDEAFESLLAHVTEPLLQS